MNCNTSYAAETGRLCSLEFYRLVRERPQTDWTNATTVATSVSGRFEQVYELWVGYSAQVYAESPALLWRRPKMRHRNSSDHKAFRHLPQEAPTCTAETVEYNAREESRIGFRLVSLDRCVSRSVIAYCRKAYFALRLSGALCRSGRSKKAIPDFCLTG